MTRPIPNNGVTLSYRRAHQTDGWPVAEPVVDEMPACPLLSPRPFAPGELDALRPKPGEVHVTGEPIETLADARRRRAAEAYAAEDDGGECD